MLEFFQRTPEGLSLVDHIVDPSLVAERFSGIITAYCNLPPDYRKSEVAAKLIKRCYALEEQDIVGDLPEAESFILKTNKAAETAGIPAGINIYRYALNQVSTLGFESLDERFVRMYFLDRIGYQFHNYPGKERDNLHLVQSVIASVYSDFELGAMYSASLRVFHDLSTATNSGSPELRGVKALITGVQMGKIEKLPENWWNREMEQELGRILSK
jgi:hypothetical protein